MAVRCTGWERTEWECVRRRDLYLSTHNTHKRQTAMPPAGFKPTIPTSERAQTHALDRAASGIGLRKKYWIIISHGSSARCVFINYNWINQLSNTTIWWLDIQSGPKKCMHSLLINIFGRNLNEISISGWECNIIYNSRTSLISILLLYKYSSYGYRVIFFVSKCVYIFLDHFVCYYMGINYMFRLLWPSSGW